MCINFYRENVQNTASICYFLSCIIGTTRVLQEVTANMSVAQEYYVLFSLRVRHLSCQLIWENPRNLDVENEKEWTKRSVLQPIGA